MILKIKYVLSFLCIITLTQFSFAMEHQEPNSLDNDPDISLVYQDPDSDNLIVMATAKKSTLIVSQVWRNCLTDIEEENLELPIDNTLAEILQFPTKESKLLEFLLKIFEVVKNSQDKQELINCISACLKQITFSFEDICALLHAIDYLNTATTNEKETESNILKDGFLILCARQIIQKDQLEKFLKDPDYLNSLPLPELLREELRQSLWQYMDLEPKPLKIARISSDKKSIEICNSNGVKEKEFKRTKSCCDIYYTNRNASSYLPFDSTDTYIAFRAGCEKCRTASYILNMRTGQEVEIKGLFLKWHPGGDFYHVYRPDRTIEVYDTATHTFQRDIKLWRSFTSTGISCNGDYISYDQITGTYGVMGMHIWNWRNPYQSVSWPPADEVTDIFQGENSYERIFWNPCFLKFAAKKENNIVEIWDASQVPFIKKFTFTNNAGYYAKWSDNGKVCWIIGRDDQKQIMYVDFDSLEEGLFYFASKKGLIPDQVPNHLAHIVEESSPAIHNVTPQFTNVQHSFLKKMGRYIIGVGIITATAYLTVTLHNFIMNSAWVNNSEVAI